MDSTHAILSKFKLKSIAVLSLQLRTFAIKELTLEKKSSERKPNAQNSNI